MKTQTIGKLQSIRVSALTLSAHNVRKTGGESIEDLAASIKAQGLIHNLTVTPINGSGRFEVVAGGRRWRALRRLIKLKALPKNHAVPCKIVCPDEAEEISLSENVIRQAMHPADQFEAFKALADKDTPIEDIAARYGVAPLVVKQRLKLANVSPALVALFRKDEVTLEQMMALAVTDDPAEQERVWNAAQAEWQRSPNELRAALTENDVDARQDRRARYIGISAYEKAGSVVRRDLFSDAVHLTDAALLDRLTAVKLERVAVRVRKEGWGWVACRTQCDYSELHAFGRLPAKLRPQTDEEEAELETLGKEQVALEQELEQGANDEREDEIDAALSEFARRSAEIEQARRMDDADDRAKVGALVLLGHDGKVQVERGLVRPEDRKALREVEKGSGKKAESGENKRAEISDALTRRLTAERTLVLRAVFAELPGHALTVLVHALVLAAFYADKATALDFAVRDAAPLARSGIKADETKAMQRLHALRGELQAALPSEAADLWTWMIAQDQATQLKFLAYCIAPAINAMQDHATSTHTTSARPAAAVQPLAALLGLDMADWWQATPENYLGAVSKANLIEAVREFRGGERAASLEKMKKADAVAAAAQALDGSRWLPGLLR